MVRRSWAGTSESSGSKILSFGAGGMGEVIEPAIRSWDATWRSRSWRRASLQIRSGLARVQREARVLAKLNDPHIAAIKGLEEAEASVGSWSNL